MKQATRPWNLNAKCHRMRSRGRNESPSASALPRLLRDFIHHLVSSIPLHDLDELSLKSFLKGLAAVNEGA